MGGPILFHLDPTTTAEHPVLVNQVAKQHGTGSLSLSSSPPHLSTHTHSAITQTQEINLINELRLRVLEMILKELKYNVMTA